MDTEFTLIRNVRITHPDKVLFPKTGITKLDLVNYYLKVEKLILAELKERPVTLVRSPDGLNSGKFVQKHPSESFPKYIERIKLKEKEGTGIYILIDEIEDILYLVNIGVLEFHTGNSLISDYEHPDRIIFDLDPDESLNIKNLYKCAFDIKELLENEGLKPKVKTSGGKGFHIVASLKEKINWDELHNYSKELVNKLAEINSLYISNLSKEDRKGKIFIDYLRNSRGGTTVAAFSTRAKEEATISKWIDWKELERTTPQQFNIFNFN